MVNAHLDILELELRKLDGVRSVGFTSQHDVLYIQLFIESNAPAATLPFEATRISQRHSNSPVAVELVRWETNKQTPVQNESLFTPTFAPIEESHVVAESNKEEELPYQAQDDFVMQQSEEQETVAPAGEESPELAPYNREEIDTINEHADFVSNELSLDEEVDKKAEEESEPSNETALEELLAVDEEESEEAEEESNEINLAQAEEEESTPVAQDQNSSIYSEIEILTVTTSAGNHEIEVHLSFADTRTIGRAATDRGLLGAIDATLNAVTELLGDTGLEAEWARSLEPTDEHASLVAVGLSSPDEDDARNGLAGGNSPIEAAAKATLNALSNQNVSSLSEA